MDDSSRKPSKVCSCFAASSGAIEGGVETGKTLLKTVLLPKRTDTEETTMAANGSNDLRPRCGKHAYFKRRILITGGAGFMCVNFYIFGAYHLDLGFLGTLIPPLSHMSGRCATSQTYIFYSHCHSLSIITASLGLLSPDSNTHPY